MIAGLLPFALAFGLGWWLRRRDWAGANHADGLLRIVVRFGLPALIFAAVSVLPLTSELLLLPLIGGLLVALMWPCSWLAASAMGLPRPSRGVLVTGPMVMNLAFLYPLVAAWGGERAVARLALIDFGNGLLTFTLVYGLAAWYGERDARIGAALGSVVRFPPFWALCLGLLINLLDWPLPEILVTGLARLGTVLVWLVPLALGIYFHPRAAHDSVVAVGIGLRVGVGALLGLACLWWFPVDELSRTLVMAAAMAPVGFNTLVFAARAGLQRELAASLASLSMLPGFGVLAWLLWWQPSAGG